jgi:phosphoenolpyruvate carboxylase
VFGFHLATSTCARAPTCTSGGRRAARARGRAADYARCRGRQAIALLAALATTPAALAVLDYSELAQRAGIFETAARCARARPRAVRNCIISHTETVSDLLEVLLLQKETGLLARHGARRARTT